VTFSPSPPATEGQPPLAQKVAILARRRRSRESRLLRMLSDEHRRFVPLPQRKRACRCSRDVISAAARASRRSGRFRRVMGSELQDLVIDSAANTHLRLRSALQNRFRLRASEPMIYRQPRRLLLFLVRSVRARARARLLIFGRAGSPIRRDPSRSLANSRRRSVSGTSRIHLARDREVSDLLIRATGDALSFRALSSRSTLSTVPSAGRSCRPVFFLSPLS